MIKVPSLKLAATGLSAVFICLLAQGQTVENVVFTEESSTVLTETLNGSPIGDWVNTEAFGWFDNSVAGTIYSSSYSQIDFADPLNAGDIFYLYPEYPTMYAGGDQAATFSADPGPSGPLTDFVPYASGDNEITTVNGEGDSVPIDVNITVQDVPEPATLALAGLGGFSVMLFRCRRK